MMAAISLQFSLQADLSSELITWFGHGAPFSHVDSILGDGSLLGARSDVVAGVPAGVQIRPPHYIAWTRVLRVDLPAPDVVVGAYYDFVRAQIGKPYDMEAILAFAAGRDWRRPDAWICSEVSTRALEVSRYFPFMLATPANKITPADEVLLCSTRVPVALAA